MSNNSSYDLEKQIQVLKNENTKLKKEYEIYSELFSLAPDLLCVADINTSKFLKVNPAFTSLLGFKEEQLLNTSFLDFVHPEDIEATISVVNDKLKPGEKVINFTNRYRCSDGTYCWLEWTSHPLPKRGITFASARDITERKKMETSLKENQNFINAVLENLPIGIAVNSVDPTVTFEYMNDKFPEFYQTKREALVDPDDFWSSVYEDPVFREQIKTRVITDCATGDPSQMIWEDIPICRKGSEPSYITAKNIPLPEKGLMISTVWDVTIRKKAEKALKESEERYKALHNASFGGLFIHDQGIILDCNQGLCEISGYAYDELIGINALENLIAPEFRETVRKNIMSGVDHPYEVVGIRKDGTSYPLNVHGKSVPYKGRIVRAVEYQDITEKVKMMEMVIQNEKMLSVGGLAAGMAHEINNPLSGVTQNAELLVNRLTNTKISANRNAAESVGTTIEAIQEFMEIRGVPRILNNITDCGVRMSTVMDNMLNFARRSDSSFNKHNPVELIENILDLAKTEYNLVKGYDFKSITIQKEFEPNLPLIACEGNQIQQVLLNLLKNGAYAMFEKCSKRKNYKPVFTLGIHKHPKSNMLQIEVEDNGPGMDKETQQKIFDPFFTTKPVDAGTGLGLYVSYFIITENHKGAMEVESELGCGTKFIIQLPYDHH